MAQYVPLDPQQHKALRVKSHSGFAFAQTQNHCALNVHEFGAAASSFPVMYMKDPQQGQFRAVALFGLVAGNNLYCAGDDWLGVYVPDTFGRRPFDLGPDPEQEKTLTLNIDQQSDYLSETEGEALYAADEPTQFLQRVQQKMAEYYQQEKLSHEFLKLLLDNKLLKEMALLIDFADGKKNRVVGLYTIDEEALRQLDDETVLALNQRNFLMPMYAMLNSLIQINRLIKLHNNSAQPKILAVNMRSEQGEM
jgi:hypothetical protein